jgi:O-antigen/teichoic acid export membrane protein
MDSAFYIRRRTGLKLGVTLASTLVMLALYAVFIPLGGALGAALATLGGFAFLTAATWRVTRRLFPVQYETRRLGGILGLALIEGFLLDWIPPGPWSCLLKFMAWTLYPLILWQAGLISPVEKGYAADLVQTIGKGVRRWVSPRPLDAAEGA